MDSSPLIPPSSSQPQESAGPPPAPASPTVLPAGDSMPTLDHGNIFGSVDYHLKRAANGKLLRSKYGEVLEAHGLPPHVGMAAALLGMDKITLKTRLRRGKPLLDPVRKYVKADPERNWLFRTKPREQTMKVNSENLEAAKVIDVRWTSTQIRMKEWEESLDREAPQTEETDAG